MELTQDEVLQILALIEKSNFDYMQLQVGELKLTVSKGNYVAAPSSGATQQTENAAKAPAKAGAAKPKEKTPAAKPKAAAKIDGGVQITAPMVGTFYAAPEPGAKPFVTLGSEIDEETTVGLIEVMKVFNAVQSRVRGKIVDVRVQNGQFVEYGATLFIVRPNTTAPKKRSTLRQAQGGSSTEARSKSSRNRTQ
ncbi:MAG TPA: acetyl-CoA carboxylase biotin carboxyl carrier protein [Candidatus Binatia bacterium]|jgi:acetyl-CoA carboxylase biotin carboxyl carrier protein